MKSERREGEKRENRKKKQGGKSVKKNEVDSCQSKHDIKSPTSGFSSSPR